MIAEGPTITTTELFKKRLGAMQRIAPCIRESARLRLEERALFASDEMIAQLDAFVWAENLQRTTKVITEETPADWWQHWKQDCAPAWFKAQWPVKMTRREISVEFELDAVFPNFVTGDDRSKYVRMAQIHKGDWRLH